ncbi:hypothetical protein FRC09_017048 [Ceratobasidium sp. 395]|nr:hypothetical protein FRC09_017048 [Ceratobasidium sp. 395]
MGNNATFGSAHIRDALFRGMYTPKRWRALARDLEACWKSFNESSTPPEQGCHALIFNPSAQANSINWSKPPAYGLQAVTCADAVDAGGVETGDVFKMMVDVTNDTSPLFGPRWGAAGFYCHKWPVRAVERYTGPWDNTLKNKIIVIGNEFDPITPFRSAESVAAALGDSAVLVQQKDYGHTSLAMHSNCTFNILHDYFLNGKLPPSKQSCGTNQPIFEDGPNSTLVPTFDKPSFSFELIDALLIPRLVPLAPAFASCLLTVLFVLSWAAARVARNASIGRKGTPAKV